jgi:hypothetical protein
VTTQNQRIEPLTPISRQHSNFWASVILVAVIFHVLATRNSWQGIALQTDTGMWAYIGGRILDGALPYRDLWESKPPGIYYTFAAMEGLFGRGGDRPFRFLDAVLSLAILAATYRLARRHARPITSAACALACSIVLCHRVLADWGCNVEKFVALFEVLALGLVVDSLDRPRMGRWFLVGICFGLAMLFKQTGIALAVVTIAWLIAHHRNRPEVRSEIACLFAGIASVWAPILVAICWAGMWPGFWEQVVCFDILRAASAQSERSRLLTPEHWRAVAQTLYLGGIIILPALLSALYWLRCIGRAPPTSDPQSPVSKFSGLVLLYLLATLAPLFIAPFGYGHYLLQAAPPATILLAWMIDHALCARRLGWLAAGIILMVASLTALPDHFRFTFDPDSKYRQVYRDLSKTTHDQAHAIAARTKGDQSVMLWPPDHALSYYAQRRTPLEASNADVLFKGKGSRLSPPMPTLLAHLNVNPPEMIVDTTKIFLDEADPKNPQLLADSPLTLWVEPDEKDANEECRLAAPLKRWVRANYGGQTRVADMTILRRAQPWRDWTEILPAKK